LINTLLIINIVGCAMKVLLFMKKIELSFH